MSVFSLPLFPLRRCFLKLGEWQLSLQGINESTIPKVLQYYSHSTEHDRNWYKVSPVPFKSVRPPSLLTSAWPQLNPSCYRREVVPTPACHRGKLKTSLFFLSPSDRSAPLPNSCFASCHLFRPINFARGIVKDVSPMEEFFRWPPRQIHLCHRGPTLSSLTTVCRVGRAGLARLGGDELRGRAALQAPEPGAG